MRLIDNQNRICFCNNVNWATGAKAIQLSEYNCSIFVCSFATLQFFIRINRFIKCLHINYHNIDGTVRCKAVDLSKLRGVIDEETNLLAVFLCKMFLSHLKGFVDALADCDARHNHNELTPTVVFVQLIHGLDVGIGLADTGLHFNR